MTDLHDRMLRYLAEVDGAGCPAWRLVLDAKLYVISCKEYSREVRRMLGRMYGWKSYGSDWGKNRYEIRHSRIDSPRIERAFEIQHAEAAAKRVQIFEARRKLPETFRELRCLARRVGVRITGCEGNVAV